MKLVLIACCLVFTACASQIKPWERGNLSADVMNSGRDSLKNSLDNHIFFSKEGSSGGGQAAGGGCGCN